MGKILDGPHQGSGKSLGNIANIGVCAVSMSVVGGLILGAQKRKAAVGEFFDKLILSLCFLTGVLQVASNYGTSSYSVS